jgi:hypothetical protein
MFVGRMTLPALAVCALVPAACSSGGGSVDLPPTVVPVSIHVVTVPGTTTTTLPAIDPFLVDDCIDYVKFGAYTGNALLSAMWDEAHQSDAVLRDNCIALGRTDPAGLKALSDGWAAVQQVLQTTSTTSTTIVPPKTPRTTVPVTEPVDTTPLDTAPPETAPPAPPETTVAPEPPTTVAP